MWVSQPTPIIGRTVDRLAYALVRAAATEIAGHGLVDLPVAGKRVAGEQRSGGHDLTRLAVPALGYFLFDPGTLQGMVTVRRQAFNGGDRFRRRNR